MPAKELDKKIKVTKPNNAAILSIAVDWADAQNGAALVNRLMELHTANVVSLRKKNIEEGLASLEGTVKACRAKFEAAPRAEADAFLANHHSRDLQADSERLDKEIAALEGSFQTAKRDCEDCEKHIKGLATGPAQTGEPAEKSDAQPAAESDVGAAFYQGKSSC